MNDATTHTNVAPSSCSVHAECLSVHLLISVVLHVTSIKRNREDVGQCCTDGITTAFTPCLTVAALGVVDQGYACSSECTFPFQVV